MMDAIESSDVVIVGAGPAGLAAASELAAHDVRVILLDEQQRPGGQIMRQPPKGYAVNGWMKGALYRGLHQLLDSIEDQPGIDWRFGATVAGIQQDVDGFSLTYGQGDGLRRMAARCVLVATGAHERPMVFPGATTPGVMGAGAIQTMLKSQQVLAGDSFVFAGAHPLQMVVAEQVLAAGGKVQAVVFAQPFWRGLSLLRRPMLPLAHPHTFMAGLKAYLSLRKAGVPVLFGHAVTSVEGREGIEAIRISPIDKDGNRLGGNDRIFTAERLGLCYGFQLSTELARQAGADVRWMGDHRGGWAIAANAWGETSIPGLYVAGELTGMAGADASMAAGHTAGIGLLARLGKLDATAADAAAAPHQKAWQRYQRFAEWLAGFAALPPHLAASLRTPESLLCRCETVRCGEVETLLATNPDLARAGSIKLQSRVGMGLCQGRMCYANFADLVADKTGKGPDALGPFQARWPVKPLPISDIIE